MCEKYVGKLACTTLTVTMGLIPKAPPLDPQSLLSDERNVTFTVLGALPPTLFCLATVVAVCVALAQAADQLPLEFFGSPVIPLKERTLAPASAAASADLCASALDWYRVPISIDSAAIAIIPTIAKATSAIVTPRSCVRCAMLRRGR
jgi:hypothetical protein